MTDRAEYSRIDEHPSTAIDPGLGLAGAGPLRIPEETDRDSFRPHHDRFDLSAVPHCVMSVR
jgi:hypothetical protein